MKYPEFNPQKDKEKIVNFIRDWFDENGKTAKAVIGISGGKDSSIVASLCVEALGTERVIGVLMPNVMQDDIIVNIGTAYHSILSQLISGRGIYNVNELCLQQHINYTKDYIHVNFNIILDTNIWDVKTFEIVNSDFGEPYFCDETSYLFIIKAISNLVMQGVLIESKNT